MGWVSRIIGGVGLVFGLPGYAQEGLNLIGGENFRGSLKLVASTLIKPIELGPGYRLVAQFPLASLSPSMPEGIRFSGDLRQGARFFLSPSQTLSHTANHTHLPPLNAMVQPHFDTQTTAFVGLGYTVPAWSSSQWRLQADLGLAIKLPHLARPYYQLATIEDTLREIRLGPSMQLQFFYSF